MRNRQRQAFDDLSPEEQKRVRNDVDRMGERAAGAVADGAIRKARSGR